MKSAARWLLTVLLCAACGLAMAQQELEIIELRGSTLEKVLPALRPLLEPGATLSGMNTQLFLRASARNRAEIKQALAAIDRPARQLIIHVANQRGGDQSDRGLGGQMVLGSGRSSIEGRVWDSRSASQENSSQRVRTLEGSDAFIQVGRALPLPMRQVILTPAGAVVQETVVYRDVGQGFYARPSVSGSRVTLDISQQADTAGHTGYGSVQVQRLTTSVSGRLGEWIELGGTGQQANTQQGSWSSREMRDQRAIWLKVEEVE